VEHLCIEQDVAVFLFFQDLCLGSRPHGAADYTGWRGWQKGEFDEAEAV
jgi:hypothetical protein